MKSYQDHGDGASFPKVYFFCSKAQILSLATNTVSYFPPSDKLTPSIFKEISAIYPSLNNYNLSVSSFFNKNSTKKLV
jgi:hypothetical protein